MVLKPILGYFPRKRKTRVSSYIIWVCELFSTTLFIFLTTATWTLYSHIICIICIYNITCISGFSRLGNIYIICIIRTIYIINISLLWTNCGHRPHPFTAIIIPYFKVQWIVRIKKSYIWQDMDSSLVFVYNYILNIRISQTIEN